MRTKPQQELIREVHQMNQGHGVDLDMVGGMAGIVSIQPESRYKLDSYIETPRRNPSRLPVNRVRKE